MHLVRLAMAASGMTFRLIKHALEVDPFRRFQKVSLVGYSASSFVPMVAMDPFAKELLALERLLL